MTEPAFRSLALRDIARPDYVDLIAVALPPGTSTDPRLWADAIFSVKSSPIWVRAAFGVRILLAPLIGLEGAPTDVFAVREVVGDEALVAADDRHLDFRCGIGVDTANQLVRVTTVVRLKGWRGRVYFAPVRMLHPVVVHSMMGRAARAMPRASS